MAGTESAKESLVQDETGEEGRGVRKQSILDQVKRLCLSIQSKANIFGGSRAFKCRNTISCF